MKHSGTEDTCPLSSVTMGVVRVREPCKRQLSPRKGAFLTCELQLHVLAGERSIDTRESVGQVSRDGCE